MSNVTVDAARVLQRLLASGGEGALRAEIAMRDVALDDAHARIAELEAAAEPPRSSPPTDLPAPAPDRHPAAGPLPCPGGATWPPT